MIKQVDTNGDVYTYGYDSNNNRIKQVTPNGDVYTSELKSCDKALEIKAEGKTICKIYKK